MTLTKHITNKIDSDLEKLRSELRAKLRDEKHIWESLLADKRKQYDAEIEQEIRHVQNREIFVAKKNELFQSGLSLSSQVNTVIEELIADILTSSLCQTSIQNFMAGVPSDSNIQITGRYSKELASIIEKVGFSNIEAVSDTNNLGMITIQLVNHKKEWSLDDLIDDIKLHTLSQINQSSL